jgi:16S rRNA (uracil1498-N3)-methyltransferase
MYFKAILPGGAETQINILSTVDNILIGECFGGVEKRPSPLPPLALFQGLPRGSKMDIIVRQAAESGVSLIAPFESEYSTVKLNNKAALAVKSDEKLKRWEKIVREARQQSGSSIETKVLSPCGFDALLDYWESLKKNYKQPLGLLLHQEPIGTQTSCSNDQGASPLAKGSFHDYLGKDPDFVALAVGPEGGFSHQEVSRFLAAGWKPLVMGNTILRTETAALYGSAAIRIILLEKETWTSSLKESCSSKFPLT